MTRNDAIQQAVARVDEIHDTVIVVRRGNDYRVSTTGHVKNGWRVAEMIGPGNVQNFREIETLRLVR